MSLNCRLINMKKVKEKVISLSKNYFFWIFLALFLGPYLFSNEHSGGRYLSLLDYISSCYWFIVSAFQYIFNIPTSVFDLQGSIFSYGQFFVGILGISQLLSLFLSMRNRLFNFNNRSKKANKVDYLLFALFIISLPLTIIVIHLIVL